MLTGSLSKAFWKNSRRIVLSLQSSKLIPVFFFFITGNKLTLVSNENILRNIKQYFGSEKSMQIN